MLYRLDAGRLRHRVSVQAPQLSAPGQMGDAAEVFQTIEGLSMVPAEIEWLDGRKLLAAQQVHAEATVTVLVRFDPRITQKCRLLTDNGHTLYPVASTPDTLERWITLSCKEHP